MANDLTGKSVCITGALSTMTREQATAQLEALGAIVTKSVTKSTDILFCGARAGIKLEKAEEYGIPIYEEADFNALVGDDAAVARAAVASQTPLPAGVVVLREIADGEVVEVQGSAATPYQLTNTGGVYSCSCPAWRNQSAPIDVRSCKHLSQVRGAAAETARVGHHVNVVQASPASTPHVLLASKWEPHIDPTGYWMSEKLDGVRALWNGKTFLSRQGNPFHAPDWFTADFPDDVLDGELWIGRGKFQQTVSVARRQDKGDQWNAIRFVMFDVPGHDGTFEERLDYMHQEFGGKLKFSAVLEHQRCRDISHLKDELVRVEALGGEGLMLREAASKYVGTRSTTLLKVKSFHDAEAVVVGYKGGQGKHRNRVGALELVTPAGIKFFAGTGLSDADRKDPPPIGTLVTYRYQELTDAGVPRFPSYVGVRIDGKWTGPQALLSAPTASTAASSTAASSTAASSTAAASGATGPTATPASAPRHASPAGANAVAKRINLKHGDKRVSLKQQGGTLTLQFSHPDDATSQYDVLAATLRAFGFVEETQQSPPPSQPSPTRRFEFDDGLSKKFWEITVHGRKHTIRFGRLGTQGTEKEKTLPDDRAAQQDAEKLIRQKTAKGYSEK